MTAQSITQLAVNFGLIVLSVSFLLTVWRVIRGPTLPDRVIALDMLVGIVMGFIALIAIRTGFTLYIDIAISLGLVGFLATVALARFILSRKRREGEDGSPPEPLPEHSDGRIDRQSPSASAPAMTVAPTTVSSVTPTAIEATPAALPSPGAPRAARSKSEVTKASAAKVKIAKAKARGQAAGAEAMPVTGTKPAQPKPPRKPVSKVVVKPLAKPEDTSAVKPVAKPPVKPTAKKETP